MSNPQLVLSAEVKTRILAPPAFHARVPLETETDDLFARTGGGTGMDRGTGGPGWTNCWGTSVGMGEMAGFKKHRLVL